MKELKRVIIDDFDDTFSLYDEAGQCVEDDFESYEEAEKYAEMNGMVVVNSFFQNK